MREGIIYPKFADKFFRIDFEASPMPVLCLYPIPAPVSLEHLQLKVCPMEAHPKKVQWAALQSLPRVRMNVPLICQIFNWSEEVEWEGIRLTDFLDFLKIETAPDGYYAFYSRDGAFFETLSRDEARDPRVLLAYGLNGGPLPVEHGGPLRLVVPFLQGYKSVKWIGEIRAFRHDPKGIKRLLGQSPTGQLNEAWKERFGIKAPQGKAGDPDPVAIPSAVRTASSPVQTTGRSRPTMDPVQGSVESSGKDSAVHAEQVRGETISEVIAILRCGKAEATRKALEEIGIPSYSIFDALGRSRQRGLRLESSGEDCKGEGAAIPFVPKEVFTVWVETSRIPDVVEALIKANRTGNGMPGDGKIFVLEVENVLRISTDEEEIEAL